MESFSGFGIGMMMADCHWEGKTCSFNILLTILRKASCPDFVRFFSIRLYVPSSPLDVSFRFFVTSWSSSSVKGMLKDSVSGEVEHLRELFSSLFFISRYS